MGYYVQSYLTDATEIKRLFGCKDMSLLDFLMEKLKKQLNELNDDFEDELSKKQNAQAILTDYINGEIRFPKLAFLYGYVYEKLCEHYGEQFFPPNDDYSVDYYWAVPKETYRAFVPIPYSADFPEIYSVLQNELLAEKENFLSIPKRAKIDKKSFEEEKLDFAFAFDYAIEQKKDLVFFLY